MRTANHRTILATLALAFAALHAPPASAQVELAGVFGGMVGGEIEAVLEGDLALEESFENSPVFGGRLGWYGWPVGLEASVVYTPSGLSASAFEGLAELDTNILYAEANVLLIPIPGPISPFATAGVGVHRFEFDFGGVLNVLDPVFQPEVTKLGWNFGGGLKANIGPISLRGDVRDHVTAFGPDDLVGNVALLLGVEEDLRLHNVEVSFGIGIRF